MTETTANNGESLHQQSYFRALLCFAAAGTLLSQPDIHSISTLHGSLVLALLVYIFLAQAITRWALRNQRQILVEALSGIDSALIGCVLGLIDFSLLPTVLFVTTIQFNALLNGGGRKWLRDNLALALGAMLSLLLHQPLWTLSAPLHISLASLIGILTYFCATALYTYTRINDLRRRNQHLETEKDTFKLRAYKLSRYLSPPVWDAISEGRDKDLQTERKRLTIFFSDIKDFSQLAEELEAETLTELLNSYLTEMSSIVKQFGGTIDKFMGDGIMVIFGDKNSKGIKQDSIRCVTMAIAMRRRMKVLQQHWHDQGIKRPLQIRMGINTGYCTVGTFGTSFQLDYTVLGTHVNLASRLESAAAPGEILLSHETWSLCREVVMCRDKGEISVKGFSHPIKVYQIVGLRKELGKNQSYFEKNLDGFSMHLDTDKLRNYDREKAIRALESAASALKEKVV